MPQTFEIKRAFSAIIRGHFAGFAGDGGGISLGMRLAALIPVWMKTGELIRRLEADGWYCVRQSGGHAIYRHPVKTGQLTVPVHPGKEIPSGTAARLLKAAGLQ